jgi:hypothetical protein
MQLDVLRLLPFRFQISLNRSGTAYNGLGTPNNTGKIPRRCNVTLLQMPTSLLFTQPNDGFHHGFTCGSTLHIRLFDQPMDSVTEGFPSKRLGRTVCAVSLRPVQKCTGPNPSSFNEATFSPCFLRFKCNRLNAGHLPEAPKIVNQNPKGLAPDEMGFCRCILKA